jgi:hypothetical protein
MFNPRHHSTPEQASGTQSRRTRTGAFGLVAAVSLLLSASLALAGQPVNAAPAAAERTSPSTVAHTDQGKMTSRMVGRTSSGERVTGTFTPLRVVKRHGDLMVKGVVDGVVHEASGRTSTFTTIRSIPVRSIGGQDVSRAAAKAAVSGRATCDILHLVLGPLDLDLLGLQVHLNRVILDIVAVTGAGNLLGNLLCAITGILDGGPLGGLLSQLSDLLNQILGALRLGA